MTKLTIRDLLHTHSSTLDQLTILMRADLIFAHRGGRYFGGVLSDSEVERLTLKLKPLN
jgi:hypothetical protein